MDFHTIRAHVDTMYLHPHGSLNAWLPLTTTRGANTLHVESEPGREDFAPVELSLGELAIFDGARCSHFTVANTSDKTRVSLDFRVVPSCAYDPCANISRVKGTGSQCYNVGGYYSGRKKLDRVAQDRRGDAVGSARFPHTQTRRRWRNDPMHCKGVATRASRR